MTHLISYIPSRTLHRVLGGAFLSTLVIFGLLIGSNHLFAQYANCNDPYVECTSGGGYNPNGSSGPSAAYVSVQLGSSPTTVREGQQFVLSWSVVYARQCSPIGDGSIGAFTVPETYQGTAQTFSQTVTASGVGSHTYAIGCSNEISTDSSYATVVVTANPAPMAALSASPASILQGNSSTLTWSSTNAASCTGSGFSTGNATSGSVAVSPSSSTNYTVTCSGPGGSVNAYSSVSVSTQPNLYSVTGPDLSATVGVPISLTGTTYNNGTGPTTGAYYDSFIIGDASRNWIDHRDVYSGNPLATGASASDGTVYTFSSVGTYSYILCADSPWWNPTQTESNESDNCTVWRTVMVSPAPAPDLTAGATTPSPSTVAYGSSVHVSAMASNIGTGASGSFPILFQFSNGVLVNSGYLGGLAASASDWGGADYVPPSAGAYQVRACANYNTSWAAITSESDYSNNCGPWASFTVSAPPAPTCSLSASPATTPSTLTWSSTGATSCTGGGFSTGGATSGSQSTNTAGSYTISCTGAGGSCSAATSVASPVCAGPATAAISANPTRVRAGQASTISWSASNVPGASPSCTISGPGVSQTVSAGAAPTCAIPAGSATPTILTQSTYTITCGGVSQSVTVNVVPKFEEF